MDGMTVQPIENVTGVILAGGKSRRMGEDKSFVPFSGRPLIQSVLDRLVPLFEDVIIVTNSPDRYTDFSVRVEKDLLPNRGPLGGIHTALLAAATPSCFVAACDMPFVNPDLVRFMSEEIDGFDLVIPCSENTLQTLCAVYSRGCVHPMERQLSDGRLKVADLLQHVAVKMVGPEEIARFDPQGASFLNINTPQDRSRLDGKYAVVEEGVPSGR
jgi:molybdopterin-guanine dinucleotide biosynthesis protein A